MRCVTPPRVGNVRLSAEVDLPADDNWHCQAKPKRSPRRAGELAVHSEVVNTECSFGPPFGADVGPIAEPSSGLIRTKTKGVRDEKEDIVAPQTTD